MGRVLQRQGVEAELVAQHGQLRRPRVLHVHPDDVVGLLDVVVDLVGRDAALEAHAAQARHRLDPRRARRRARHVVPALPLVPCHRPSSPRPEARAGRMPPRRPRRYATPAWPNLARAGVSRPMASSRAAQAASASPQSCSRPADLQAAGRLGGRRGPEVGHRPLQGVGRLPEARGVPPDDRLADLRHPLRALVEEEPGQLLQQLHVPAHPLQGRGQVEGRRPGPLGAAAGGAGSAAAAGTRPSRTSKSSSGRSGLET